MLHYTPGGGGRLDHALVVNDLEVPVILVHPQRDLVSQLDQPGVLGGIRPLL